MTHPHPKKSGQAMLFLIWVLVVAAFVVAWNFDLHRAVILKMKVRDGGDAAALACARWQGIQLNTLGELNLIQAVVLTEYANNNIDPQTAADEINSLHNLRHRVQWSGSVVAFAAAQQAAFNNGIRGPNDLSSYQKMYKDWLNDYGNLFDPDFINFFQSVVDNGVAVMTLYPHSTDYYVLDDRNFYDAIQAAHDHNWWCLFQRDPDFMKYLESYSSPDSWPELPDGWGYPPLPFIYAWEMPGSIATNIAAFYDDPGIDLASELQTTVDEYPQVTGKIDVGSIQHIWQIVDEWGMPLSPRAYVYWATYGDQWKGSWNDDIQDNELQVGDSSRPIKDEYDYLAGQSVFRMEAKFDYMFRKKNDSNAKWTKRMEWTSAAKVFGDLDGRKPSYFGLVLPAFRDVRLVPVPRAAEKVYPKILKDYLKDGISSLDKDGDGQADNGDMYAQLLIYFDDPDFRQQGLDWLAEHGDECSQSGFSPYGNEDDKEKGPPYAH